MKDRSSLTGMKRRYRPLRWRERLGTLITGSLQEICEVVKDSSITIYNYTQHSIISSSIELLVVRG